MSDSSDISTELQDINANLTKLNDTIQTTAITLYKGIIWAAKMQSAQTPYERNTAIKEADDFLKLIEEEN